MKINRETQIGLLVTVALAMLIWGVNYLKGRNLLTSDNTYYAVYSKVDGLSESAPVLVNGYNIGKVARIQLNQKDDNQLVVTMEIDKDYEVPENTEAQIQSTDFIGGKAVVLLFPDDITGYHGHKDTLHSSYQEGLNAMLDKVEGKADELITSFDSVLLSLNNILNAESQQHLRGVFENLDGITYELRSSMLPGGDLDESLGNLKEFSNTLASNAQNIDVMSSNLAVFTDTLAHLELNQTIKELHMVLEESKSMLETVNSAEGTAGKLVYNDSLYVNLNQVSMSLDQLLTDLKENPGRYVQFSLFGRKDKENSNNSK